MNKREHEPRRWAVADLIDFEMELDKASPADANADRALFVKQTFREPGTRADDREAVFLAWLRARQEVGAPTAGELFQMGVNGVRFLAIIAGLLLGATTTAGLLSHESAQPVNALMFLAGTVGLQLGVIVLVLVTVALRAAGVQWASLRSWIEALVQMVARLFGLLKGERRNRVRELLARIEMRSDRVRPYIGLEVLQLTQDFAISFNLGILGAMALVYLPFTELRFGWQSTYSFGPDAVATAVRAIAAPWSWISDALVPSRDHVLATEFARGQSSLALDRSAARAWWPFLLCAVAFYGLGLRLLARMVLSAMLHLRLRRLPFEHPAAHALWRRLHGPLIVSEGGDAVLPNVDASRATTTAHARRALVIQSDAGALSGKQLRDAAQRCLGWNAASSITASIDDDRLGPEVVAALQSRPDGVVIVVPAAQNPIVAIASFLREVRASTLDGADVVVLLVGGPDAAEHDVSLMEARHQIWSRFATIHRLGVGVEQCR
jgi:hypothetical protein